MNLDKLKELEDLKEEVSKKQAINHELYEEKVKPELKIKSIEFLDAFEDMFKSKEFDIEKKAGNVSAKYKSLVFSAISQDGLIYIKRGNDEIAIVAINYRRYDGSGAYSVPNDPFLAEKASIQRELDRLNKNTDFFKNPTFSFTNLNNNRKYQTPNELLEDLAIV